MTFRPTEAAVAARTARLNVMLSSAAANTQSGRQTAGKEKRVRPCRQSEEDQETEQMDKSDQVKQSAKGERERTRKERQEQQEGGREIDAGRQIQVGTTHWERRTQEDRSRA